jgi:hypothetical protein
MPKNKQKRSAQRLSPRQRRLLVIVVLVACVVWLKRDAIGFRLYNFVNPIYGELVFHADLDGDGIPQLYHLTFNTGFKYTRIEQLTSLPAGATYGAYSPDGTQLAFQSDDAIFVMNTDGSDMHELVRSYGQPSKGANKPVNAFRPVWLNETLIVYHRLIGYYYTDMLTNCPVTAPFAFDLTTGLEAPLFVLPEGIQSTSTDEGQWIRFGGGVRGIACRGGASGYKVENPLALSPLYPASWDVPEDPATHNAAYKLVDEYGFLVQAAGIFAKRVVLAGSNERLARAVVYPYWDVISGIEIYNEGEWQLILPVHSDIVAWSPDERYLVYDALHLDGTWVLAITSTDGRFTYPLIGNDGKNYFAPSWRP